MRPSLVWVALALSIGVLGAVGSGVLIGDLIEEFDFPDNRFTTPGATTVHLDEAREQTIYQQIAVGDALIDDEVDSSDLSCRVTGPAEEEVAVSDNDFSYTTSEGDEEYAAKLDFDPPRGGDYRVRCTSKAGPLTLAVGDKFRPVRFVSRLIGGIAAFFGGVLVAAGVTGWVLYARGRRRREPPSQA